MPLPVSVIVPVGPFPSNQRWLKDCLMSIQLQGELPGEVIVIDDMAKLTMPMVKSMCPALKIRLHKNEWRLGVAASVNIGMALSYFNLVVWLNSDDQLMPGAIQAVYDAYLEHADAEAFYSFTLKYSSSGELQDLPVIGAYTKGLWNLTGGFPPEAAVGACDHIFTNMMQTRNVGKIYKVGGGPHYLYREHPDTETRRSLPHYASAMGIVRDAFAETYTPPDWTP